jgi:caffeoyl-CoA O-methyltransferase
MNFIEASVSDYLRNLCDRFDDPVVVEMEKVAEEKGFPIVGRVVGATLEMLTRAIGGRRVFEMGSGYGFSAYWFARAVGDQGEVILTDGDPDNAKQAEEYLSRAGLWDRCRFEVGDAIESLKKTEGEFDVIYCDIDKEGYPSAFENARGRLRVGGLYLCDNVLWSGRVASDEKDELTQAIHKQNEMIYADTNFAPAIIPTRDGVIAALRVR